jgi:hypothetical protein
MANPKDPIPPIAQKWVIVLPPEGAARQVGEKAWESLCALLPPEKCKLFDTKPYLDAFDRLLKQPTDEMVVDLTNQALVVQTLDFDATHILVIALAPITFFTANLLKRHKVVTAHWFIEDFRQAKYWKDVLPSYRHFFAIQKGPLVDACHSTGSHYHYLPTAFILPAQPKIRPWEERPACIAFIGFPSRYRIEILEALMRAGLPLKVAGAGWEKYRGPLEACLTGKGWFGPEEAYKLLDASRIGLHLSSEDPQLDRDNSHLSPRIFDIMAAGCILMTEAVPLVHETLGGCTYLEFNGAKEAVEAARRALSQGLPPGTLEFNRGIMLQDHTMSCRMSEVLKLSA